MISRKRVRDETSWFWMILSQIYEGKVVISNPRKERWMEKWLVAAGMRSFRKVIYNKMRYALLPIMC